MALYLRLLSALDGWEEGVVAGRVVVVAGELVMGVPPSPLSLLFHVSPHSSSPIPPTPFWGKGCWFCFFSNGEEDSVLVVAVVVAAVVLLVLVAIRVVVNVVVIE